MNACTIFIGKLKAKAEDLIIKYPLGVIFILYLLANIFFITNNFLYWDDWCWTGNKFSDYFYISRELGSFYFRGIFGIITYCLPPVVCRILVFISFYFSTVFFYKILNFVGLNKNECFSITILYVLNPLIETKYSLCVAGYYFSLFEFSLASYFLICKFNTEKKIVFFRISSLILFFFSFQFNSLLCFYAVPFCYIFYKEVIFNENRKNIVNKIGIFVKKYFLFLLLPFVFFIIKLFFLQPLGVYATEGYNNMSLTNLFHNIMIFPKSFYEIFSYLWPFMYLPKIMLLIFFLFIVNSLYRNKKIKLFVFSIFAFFFAILPYAAVGKAGMAGTFTESRHYLLTLLSFAIFLHLFVNNIFEYKKPFYCLLILFFVVVNEKSGYKLFKDQIICESFVENIKENELIKNNYVFEYHEENPVGYYARNLENYKLFGLFWRAYGNQRHVAYNVDLKQNRDYIHEKYAYVHAYTFVPDKVNEMIDEDATHRINFIVKKFGKKQAIKAYFLNFIPGRKKYREYIKKLSDVNVIELK